MNTIVTNIMNIKIKLLHNNARFPVQATSGAAGYDLYNSEEHPVWIEPGESRSINLGIAMEIPYDYVGLVFPRSGMARKHQVTLTNCVGVVDSDFRAQWVILLQNNSTETFRVEPGDRVAQLVVVSKMTLEFTQADELSETTRDQGGWGSTGMK